MKRNEKEYKRLEKAKSKEYENSLAKLNAKLEETEKKLKTSEENLKNLGIQLNRENAILSQKIEFAEHSLNEYKTQLEEERKQHSNMLLSLNGNSGLSNDDLETQLQRVRQQYLDQIKSLEVQNETSRKDLSKQIEILTQKNTELELDLKCQSSD